MKYLATTLLLLAACTTVKPVPTPNGQGFLISCPDKVECLSKAREVCGGNYKLLNADGTTYITNGVASSSTELLIECNTPGEEGNACYPNATCNEGLTCANDVCVAE